MMAEYEHIGEAVARQIAAVQRDIAALRSDVDDLSTAVRGREAWGLSGLLARVEDTEKRLLHVREVQDGLVSDQKRYQADAERRAKLHNRVQVAVLSLLTTTVGGIIILLVQLLLAGGGPS